MSSKVGGLHDAEQVHENRPDGSCVHSIAREAPDVLVRERLYMTGDGAMNITQDKFGVLVFPFRAVFFGLTTSAFWPAMGAGK